MSRSVDDHPWRLQDWLAVIQIIVFAGLVLFVLADAAAKMLEVARRPEVRAQLKRAQELAGAARDAAEQRAKEADSLLADAGRRMKDAQDALTAKEREWKEPARAIENQYGLKPDARGYFSKPEGVVNRLVAWWQDLSALIDQANQLRRETERMRDKCVSAGHRVEQAAAEALRLKEEFELRAREWSNGEAVIKKLDSTPAYSLVMVLLHLSTAFYAGVMLIRSSLRFCQFRGYLIGACLSRG